MQTKVIVQLATTGELVYLEADEQARYDEAQQRHFESARDAVLFGRSIRDEIKVAWRYHDDGSWTRITWNHLVVCFDDQHTYRLDHYEDEFASIR